MYIGQFHLNFLKSSTHEDLLEVKKAPELDNKDRIRAGSGHFFHGAGWVSGLWFWLGSGSGYKKFPQVHFRL